MYGVVVTFGDSEIMLSNLRGLRHQGGSDAVSYTHLDVYKRQDIESESSLV